MHDFVYINCVCLIIRDPFTKVMHCISIWLAWISIVLWSLVAYWNSWRRNCNAWRIFLKYSYYVNIMLFVLFAWVYDCALSLFYWIVMELHFVIFQFNKDFSSKPWLRPLMYHRLKLEIITNGSYQKPFWHLLNAHSVRLAAWIGDGSKRQCSWINVCTWIDEMYSGWCSSMMPDNWLKMLSLKSVTLH